MSYLDRVTILHCIQCKNPLDNKQSYRKNKYCSNKCMGVRYTLPDRVGRMKAHDLKYRTKNKEALALSRFNLTSERKKKVYEALGNVCTHCGFSDYRALQIDHVHGFGKRDKINKRHTNAKAFYLFVYESVSKNEGKYQILCANCNWIKRYSQKEQGWDYVVGRNQHNPVAKLVN